VVSETSFPRKCGFCTHRFSSRQERIDHIAGMRPKFHRIINETNNITDHFKKGKCMLDWNDDEDDTADSDNMDDDDNDKPDSDSFDGSSNEQPDQDPQGHPGPKQNGNGNNGRGGREHFSGFGQFQLSQLKTSDAGTGEHGYTVEQQSCSWNKPNNAGDGLQEDMEPRHHCSSQEQCFFPEQRSIHEQRSIIQSHAGCIKAEGDDTDLLARNAIARTLIDTNTQNPTPMGTSKDIATLATNPPLQQCEREGMLTERGQINPKPVVAISKELTADMAGAQQDGGPVSTPSSCVLPVTESILPEGSPQSDGKLHVESSPIAGTSSEEIPRDRLRLLTLEGGGIRDSTLIVLMEHLMGELKNEDETGRRARLRDFFDVIGGTSTGGYVANTMCSNIRLTNSIGLSRRCSAVLGWRLQLFST
jgi:hypothetical protein